MRSQLPGYPVPESTVRAPRPMVALCFVRGDGGSRSRRIEKTMGDQRIALRQVRRPSRPTQRSRWGRSVHRPSARLYGSWLWGITCVQERRLQLQRTSCEVLLIARRCPVCQQKWIRSAISGDGTDDSGGGTLLGSFRSSGRCSLTWAALSFVTICLDKSGKHLSDRAAGGPCASNRARPLESRISP